LGAFGLEYLPPDDELRLIAQQREWALGESVWLNNFLPVVDDITTHVMWEVLGKVGGRATVVDYDGDLRAIPRESITAYIAESLIWGGMVRLGEKELLELQKYRTGSPSYSAAIDKLFARKVLQLDERLEKALAWVRLNALLGKVSLDENGIKRTIKYGLTYDIDNPLAAGSDWSNLGTGTPLTNLDTIANSFVGSGGKMKWVILNSNVMAYIVRNTVEVKDMFKQSEWATRLSVTRGPDILKAIFPYIDFIVYDGVIDGSLIVPDDYIVCIADGGERLGEFVSTVTLRHGDIRTPAAGKFTRTIDKTDEDPPHVKIIHGMAGIPVLYHPEWVTVVDVKP